MLLMAALLTGLRRWAWLAPALREPRVLGRFVASALLVANNWLVFIWAVLNDHLLEASLGYYINPLMSVAAGALLLHERLRTVQWLAVAIASFGVLWLTWHTGRPPWIALVLAASFASYGVLRKTGSLGAVEGLTLETLLLAPFALAFLGWSAARGDLAFTQGGPGWMLLLAAAGPLTTAPLLLFAASAQRIPLSLMGMMQFLGPSIQVVLGVLVFHEPLQGARLTAFVLIWLACALFSADLLLHTRRDRSVQKARADAGIIEA
jgi:chloramphenicol-sensitive protein RarD